MKREIEELEEKFEVLEIQKNELSNILDGSNLENVKTIIGECKRVYNELQSKVAEHEQLYNDFISSIRELEVEENLTKNRIEKFEHFKADDTHISGKCPICMENIEIGMELVRLDCDGRHTTCKECVYKWFECSNSCPICRTVFVE